MGICTQAALPCQSDAAAAHHMVRAPQGVVPFLILLWWEALDVRITPTLSARCSSSSSHCAHTALHRTARQRPACCFTCVRGADPFFCCLTRTATAVQLMQAAHKACASCRAWNAASTLIELPTLGNRSVGRNGKSGRMSSMENSAR